MHQTFSIYRRIKPRILLVDNDPEARISYQSLLQEWGYMPVLAMGIGSSLQDDARKKAQEQRCCLALIDLRLHDDEDQEDMSGAEFAESMKRYLQPIILTGTDDPNTLRKLLQDHQNIPFIGKHDRRDEFRKRLDAEASKVSATKRNLEIIQDEIMDDFMQSELVFEMGEYTDQVANIIARMFPNAQKIKFAELVTSDTEVSSATRPNSIVLRVFEDDMEACVVKIARTIKIEKEASNFREFISRKLTGGFTPQQIGKEVFSWDVGGIAYTYEGGKNAMTFANYYREQDYENIEKVLTAYFFETWDKYYTKPINECNTTLYKLFSRILGDDWFDKCKKEISKPILNKAKADLAKYNLPQPIDWLTKKITDGEGDFSPANTLPSAIIHGDLHGDNLLVDNKNIVWVIDFERCGRGYAMQDFIQLETDILSRMLGHEVNESEYYEMCMLLFRQPKIQIIEEIDSIFKDEKIQKAVKTISSLRGFAAKCSQNTNIREYLMGLLFNMLFKAMLAHKEDPQKSKRPLIIAGFLCHRLDHWGDIWPPTEWKFQ